jgi:hypothetical protein
VLAERLEKLKAAPSASLRPKRDPQLINNFLAQGMDILLDAESLLQRWQQHPGERQELSALLDELTTLEGGGGERLDLGVDQGHGWMTSHGCESGNEVDSIQPLIASGTNRARIR